MTRFGTSTTSCAYAFPAPAKASPNAHAARKGRGLMPSPHVLGYCGSHLVRRLDDLRVHLVGALRRDQLGDLLYRINVGSLEVTLLDGGEARVAGHADI